MRTTGAERGRTARHVIGSVHVLGFRHVERALDEPRTQLAVGRERAGEIGDANTKRSDLVGEVVGALFDDVNLVDLLREVLELVLRQRPGNAQFQHRGFGQRVAHVLVHGARAHDAYARIAHLDAVVGAFLDPFAQLGDALELNLATRFRERGHHDPFRGALLVRSQLYLLALPHLDGRLRMRYAYRRSNDEGNVELLRKRERVARESERFGRISRIHRGHMGRERVEARILLVLRGVHARVIGGENDESAVHARVGCGEQRVGSHVHAHMLHRRQNAGACGRCAHANLDGHFLVRAPFGVNAFIARERFHRLRRRGAGIGHADARACLPCPAGDGFVSAHQFHAGPSPLFLFASGPCSLAGRNPRSA